MVRHPAANQGEHAECKTGSCAGGLAILGDNAEIAGAGMAGDMDSTAVDAVPNVSVHAAVLAAQGGAVDPLRSLFPITV
jgi:hypothetical protein